MRRIRRTAVEVKLEPFVVGVSDGPIEQRPVHQSNRRGPPNLTVYKTSLPRQLEEEFQQDLKYSRQITYEEWNARGIGERISEFFAFPVKEYP